MPVDILTPDGKKTSGQLIEARVRVIPMPGEFAVRGHLISMSGENSPEVVVSLDLRGDTLAIIDHALGQFRNSFRAAVKQLVAEMRAAGLPTSGIETPSAEDIKIVKDSKGS